MGRGKEHNEKAGAIQAEQLKLVKIQRELETLLRRVNESINELKVEELQLKSNAVDAMQFDQEDSRMDSPEPPARHLKPFGDITTMDNQSNLDQWETEVNKQEINLDMVLLPTKGHVEEEDESD